MEFSVSNRKNKKYEVRVPAKLWNKHHPDDKVNSAKIVHFGDKRYQHYKDQIGNYSHLDHLDKERRKNYRNRHSAITTKNGKLAYKQKYSPSWFSYYYLW